MTTGRNMRRPLKMLIYGVRKIGKSTLAMGAPAPLFADAERGTLNLDVKRVEATHWSALGRIIGELRDNQHHYKDAEGKPHAYKTLVIDTLDSWERLLVNHVCHEDGVDSIEKVGGGYGKGWTQVSERWARIFEEIDRLQVQKGMNLIALAHAGVSTFRDPGGTEYNTWGMRISKKSAAMWEGWIEDILFATRLVKTKRRSKTLDSSKESETGQRVLFTDWTPGREAGNRRNLPPVIALSWEALRKALVAEVPLDTKTLPTELEGDQAEAGSVEPEPEKPPCAHAHTTACAEGLRCDQCGDVLPDPEPDDDAGVSSLDQAIREGLAEGLEEAGMPQSAKALRDPPGEPPPIDLPAEPPAPTIRDRCLQAIRRLDDEQRPEAERYLGLADDDVKLAGLLAWVEKKLPAEAGA